MEYAEKVYSQIEKEGIFVIFGVKKFYKYLFCTIFELATYYIALITIFNPEESIPQYSENRFEKWSVILSTFPYDTEYM